ncbi:MAG: BREX system P-loop protein BrxC [Pirellulaceae bacterium]
MKLNSIFLKPVDRAIEGVIKADDSEHLQDEVEEYVLTNEVEKRLEEFLDAYNNYHGANGAWISGFFGSGKSHLLKMISLLLSNEDVGGRSVVDSFLQKCGDNKILKGAIEKSGDIASKSILFNIDQKADVISKTEIDALLSVFVKVFNESCGYYGKQGYIAEFERVLDEDGLLDGFKQEFAKLEERGWEWARMRVNRFITQIDAAYAAVTGQKVDGIIDRYRADYSVSIEDFANQVNSFIRKQPAKNFRLNFFVDEVGQFIADNIKLMTNLQTIAESLATKCKGQAWIIVTGQEDMNTVVGEMEKQQGNDFSKIQARFKNRLPLTSKDVAEVIQKRLLAKTDAGKQQLDRLYAEQSNNFQTLFTFSDGSVQFRNYQDNEHFCDCYPFVPYQFDLFQSSIRNLSERNAFTGKHSSVGERSMLGVFQDVAKGIADHAVGQLATFDMMFEGLRTVLKSQIQSSIINAERNITNPLAVRLLKALFLVKYVREFKPTVRNLCVLMLDRFGMDLGQLQTDVEEALNLLENQVYIQRSGELYEFLTDEEKDVEQEIKNTEVDTADIAEELSKIIFDQVIRAKKLRYDETRQDYPFTRKLDDRVFGRTHELSVHIVSPFHDEYQQLDQIKMRHMGQPELLVVLPADDRLFRDIQLFKQTEKYISQNFSLAKQDSVKRILTEKTFSNQDRQSEIADSLKEALGMARMFVANSEVESKSQDPNTRIHEGFEELIRHTYTNLPMLRGIQYSENEIEKCLRGDDNSLFAGDATVMSEAETEMLSAITRKTQSGLRVTVKQLVEDFEKKPFGWYLAAIQCTLAKLCGRSRIEVRSDGQILEDGKLAAALKNTRLHGNLVLEPQIEFPGPVIRRVKEFFQDFFDRSVRSTEPKGIAEELTDGFSGLQEELTAMMSRSHAIPFLSTLAEPVAQLKVFAKKPVKYFFTEFESEFERLLDLKENLLDPIRRFMSGAQLELYSKARKFLTENDANFSYLDGGEHRQLEELLNDPQCYSGTGIQQIKKLHEALQQRLETLAVDARVAAESAVTSKVQRLTSIKDYDQLTSEQRAQIEQIVQETIQQIRSQPLIAVVKEAASRFENHGYNDILSKVTQWTRPPTEEYRIPSKGDAATSPTPAPVAQFISLSSLDVEFPKPWLESEPDVDAYLATMKKAMMLAISENKRIQI